MKKKQILVCGTGFGKIYLKAIAESKEYELMGILILNCQYNGF